MSNIELEYLPWSSRRYKITSTGKVLNSFDQELETIIKDNNSFVLLEWIDGVKYYQIGLLVLVTFKKLTLDEHLLKEVEILYIDQDSENNTLANLIYRFINGNLEVELYPGYYYIPLYTNYAINKNQDLINIKTGKKKTWSVTTTGNKNETGGYLYTRLVSDDGYSRILFLHRAMCMVFYKYDEKLNSMVVNHKDGNPSNNKKENLEWSTYSLNNQHAYDNGLRPNSSSPVLVKDLNVNKVTEYSSLSECARSLKIKSPETIRMRIINSWGKVYSDKLLFKLKSDERPWPDLDVRKLNIVRRGRPELIIARNVFSGKTIIFKGAEEGSLLTGVNKQTLLNHVNREINIPVLGFNFRYLEKNINWPKHSKRHLLIYEDFPIYPPNGAIVENIETKEEKFYTSTAKAMHELKVSRSLFYYTARKEKLLKGKFLISIFDVNTFYGPDSE